MFQSGWWKEDKNEDRLEEKGIYKGSWKIKIDLGESVQLEEWWFIIEE